MKDFRSSLGSTGEKKAADYLRQKGFNIIEQNVHLRVGEIDIIAQKDNKIVFFEVRTKISDKHGRPADSFTNYKKSHFAKAIRWYLMKHTLKQYKLSVDFISVILYRDRSVKEIVHYENVMQPQGMY